MNTNVLPESSQKADLEMGYVTQAPPEAAVQNVTPLQALADMPAWVICPFCKERAMTTVTKESSARTQYVSSAKRPPV